ncbi:MAG: hypothetical protein AAFO62_00495 [Pseudomonadota bacterium]
MSPQPPTCVVLLAEHLDRVLAAGEDMIGLTFDARTSCATGVHEADSFPRLSEFVADLELLELTLAMRVTTARERAEELAADDKRFETIVRLFVSATRPMFDAHARLTAPRGDTAQRTTCATTYLSERAVLKPGESGPCGYSLLEVGEHFRIAGEVELGPLLDLVSAFVDAIEIHYEVFPEASEMPLLPGPPSLGSASDALRSAAKR